MNKDRWIAYGIDAFLASLFTFSCSQSFLRSVNLPISFIGTLLWSICFCVALITLLWNRRTLILLLPSLIVLFFVYTRLYLPVYWWKTLLFPFFSWLPTLIKENATPRPDYLLPVTILTTWAFSLPATLMIRNKSHFIPLFIFMLLVIGTEWSLGHHEIITVIPFLLFTLVMVYIRSNYRMYIKKLKLSSSGLTWQIWFIPIVILPIILAVLLTTPNPAIWKWRYLAETVERINEDFNYYPAPERISIIYHIKDTGYQPLDDRLGGTIAPNQQLRLLVQSPYPINLRGSIQNEYTGNAWKDTVNTKSYVMNHQTKAIQKSILYDPKLPNKKLFTSLTYNTYIQSIQLKIKTAALGTSTLFTPCQTSEIVASQPGTIIPYFNTQGEIFAQGNIIAGTEYTLQARYFQTAREGFPNFINQLLQNTINISDPQEKRSDKDYLQLPTNYSATVTQIAETITRHQITDYDKIIALKQYLQNGFTYTLQPGTPPKNRDFVEYFLETKKGYCTYYATALTVMARTLRIPARYVEGFSLPASSNKDGYYEVTNENAHAWVEVYFHGIGWIPFDPTPLPLQTNIPVQKPTTDNKATTGPTHSNMLDNKALQVSKKAPLPATLQIPLWWIISAGTLGILLTLLYLPIAIKRIQYHPYLVKKFIQNPEEIIRYYYHDILQLLRIHQYIIEPGETLLAYSERVDKHFPILLGNLYDITEILMKTDFSRNSISMDMAQKVIQFHQNLMLVSPKMISQFNYYKKRYLFLLG